MTSSSDVEPAIWARPVVHWEIEARDPDVQRAFYSALFNWAIDGGPIMNIPAGLGGPEPGPSGHIRQSGESRINLYVQVADLSESLEHVPRLGGAVVTGLFDVPGGPTIAGIEDPEGNSIVLVQQ
jgi:uncharacterized protein